MDGSGDEFLASTGLALDQHRRIGGRDDFHLLEHAFERRTLADDLLEIMFGTDFVFEVELFLGQFVFQLGDLLIGQDVVHRNRNLFADLLEEFHVRFTIDPLLQARKSYGSQPPYRRG